ncbi:LacI family DNA-binding transcriptional regulator [Sanguibacter suaedae]|uniref:LacI family DNA-binding transcriptional regulator n=1 Tax=Sanguibacter suaedae TaxID=2795737 RepID=UPI0027DE3109|nr:LacI family DNA-binding transcriptional regulator [Sanguibacter suaedae]
MTSETPPEFTHSGSKRPTITDVARAAGVSIAVVSYALNGRPGVSAATRDRVLRIADEHGWRPNAAARSLRTTTRSIGLALVRGDSATTHPAAFMELLDGIQGTLAAKGLALVLQVVEDHDAAATLYRTWWAERRFDALLLTDVLVDDPRVEALRSARIPAVALCHPGAARGLASVHLDESEAYARTGRLLTGLGHRRVGLVTGPEALDSTARRVSALRAAVEEAGGALVDAPDAATQEDAAAATRVMLTSEEAPSAVVLSSDLAAVTALDVARRLHRDVPWDVSIVAGRDAPGCRLATPSVTTLPLPLTALGEAAGNAVLDLLDGERPVERVVPVGALTIRGTTAPFRR